ncbi:glycosyltransferase family 2 protein [Seonamhaeicola sp.]|uniref:glycosyltransferase family 2 protein n=1 Tax=Seonamhaeicola sp. TaxID=1912245 RepID=UPI0035692EE5
MEQLSVVIVTYNGAPWIEQCLTSIQQQTIDCSMVVVDNNSTDATVSLIQDKFPEATVLPQKNNLGFGAANNIGISTALKNGATYVFLLNQDAYFQTTTLAQLLQVAKKNPQYGIISPIHLNGDGTKLDLNFSGYIKQSNQLFYDALFQNFKKDVYSVPFVNAAGWLLSEATLKTIGGFDPIFFHYGEDDNYCQRVIYHKLKVGVVPNTYLYHDREFRERNPKPSIKAQLQHKERYLKCTWGNINKNINKEVTTTKRAKLKLLLKLLLKLQFSKVAYHYKEWLLLHKIIPEIEKSRNTNLQKGAHYLKV